MLTRLYVEALLVDSVLADQVWELWDAEVITDDQAARAWWNVAIVSDLRELPISHRLMSCEYLGSFSAGNVFSSGRIFQNFRNRVNGDTNI